MALLRDSPKKVCSDLQLLRTAVAAVLVAFLALPALANHTNPRFIGGPGHPRPFASLAAPHLTYYGGPVLSNVRVVMVLYGSGTYLAQVALTTTPNMATFYAGVTNSAYMDWLNEYNTASPVQHIGRGTYYGMVQITPSAGNNGSTIDDANIQVELVPDHRRALARARREHALHDPFPGRKIHHAGRYRFVRRGGFLRLPRHDQP